MRSLPLLLLVVALILGGGAGALSNHSGAGAVSDYIKIRVRPHDKGSFVVERGMGKDGETWVRVGTISPAQTPVSELLLHGSSTLPVSFARVSTRATGGSISTNAEGSNCESELVREYSDGTREYRTTCTEQHATAVTCDHGLEFRLGLFESFADALEAGLFGFKLCASGDLLQGLALPSTMMTFEELQTKVTQFLGALSPPRTLDHLRDPPEGRSDTREAKRTSVEVRLAQWLGDPQAISVRVRARGDDWIDLEMDTATYVEVHSDPP